MVDGTAMVCAAVPVKVTRFALVEGTSVTVPPILAFANEKLPPAAFVIEPDPAMAAVPVEFNIPLFVKAAFIENVPETLTVEA